MVMGFPFLVVVEHLAGAGIVVEQIELGVTALVGLARRRAFSFATTCSTRLSH